MKEQTYQKKLIEYLEKRGAYVVKVISASKKGVPDIIACYKGKFIGVEVKTPQKIKNTTELQEYNLKMIQQAGGYAIVACYEKDLEDIIEEIDG
jgi:Holliday junction resolvase